MGNGRCRVAGFPCRATRVRARPGTDASPEREAERNSVAPVRPERHLWVGHRPRAPATRVRLRCRIGLADAWPRLRPPLPDRCDEGTRPARAALGRTISERFRKGPRARRR
ncbi:hypothetical protein ACFW6E_12175 [Streptomyces olivaceoviridis]|uniref:hypothetical protein n=1 Tax=Streptomyces olivaceoviridis TaxID=1921 RepID=UPI0036B165F2